MMMTIARPFRLVSVNFAPSFVMYLPCNSQCTCRVAPLRCFTVKNGDASGIIQLERVCLQELSHFVQDDVCFALW